MSELEPWVGVSDVIPWVDPQDHQTSQATESQQLRGERPCRRGREPAYVVRTSTPGAVIPPDEPVGSAKYISDVDAERFDEDEIARLQSFPESFHWTSETKTDTRQLIGNAVPSKLAEAVASELPE